MRDNSYPSYYLGDHLCITPFLLCRFWLLFHSADKYGNDIREHQSWVMPSGSETSEGSTLINLYQRSCLTIDRDAPPGDLEIWVTALENYDAVVLFLNKVSDTHTSCKTLN